MANLGYAEIVDTACNAIGLYQKFSAAVSDGIDFQDAFVILQEFETLKEIYEDRGVFIAEFMDLTPSESEAAVLEISQKTNVPQDKVYKAIVEGLALGAQWHKQVVSVIDLVQETRMYVENNFGKKAA